jgi:class 3 adenylate cyclase
LLINAALTAVGTVVWYEVNRERQAKLALAAAEGELRDVNQHLEERVARQVEEIESARQLQRYLSPQLAQAILAGQSVELTTTRKEVTVFFSDIRGFTSLSEQLEPEELIQMMNEYLSAMTAIVFQFEGTLDKYIGDAIMVFFNDPTEQADHAVRCVQMARAMQAKLAELQAGWFAQGSEPLSMGIGINTGFVTVGNIGSTSRMEYTVLGNNVNLASRLCSAAQPGQILVSQKTQGLVAEKIETRFLREETIKGKARPVKLYEVVGDTIDSQPPAASHAISVG